MTLMTSSYFVDFFSFSSFLFFNFNSADLAFGVVVVVGIFKLSL